FGPGGTFVNAYDFGWDTTPAFFQHGGTYSIVLQDNHYESGGPYFITQLDANLDVEWKFQGDAEWASNALAVDGAGVVYANTLDGNLYAVEPGGAEKRHLLLGPAPGTAYTA